MARRSLAVLAIAITAVPTSAGLGAGTAEAKRTVRIVSAPQQDGVFEFRLRHRPGHRIVASRIRVGRVQWRLSTRRVRRAARRDGRLRARLAARHRVTAADRRHQRAHLLVTTARSRRPAAEVRTPASGRSACDFGTFGVGRWPGACWRPYSDASPFNRRIPTQPRLHPNSQAIVRRVVGFGAPNNLVTGEAGTADDWGHPTYYPSAEDPEFTVHCVEDWGQCSIEGHKIRIPDRAQAAGGGDGHMTVVDQQSGWEYDFWQVHSKPSGGGRINISWGGRTRIDGDGLGSDATASRFGNLAGIVRAQELAAGQINHALFMVINCDSGEHVYPAQKGGRPCTDIGQSNENAPPMGARFQLAMSDAQIEALAVPAYKKTLLRAMAHYGLYFGDTGGASWGIQVESGTTYSSFGKQDPLLGFAERQNLPVWEGRHVFDVKSGVDWERYLRVVDPCVAQSTC